MPRVGRVSQIHFSVIVFHFPIMKVYTLEDKALTKIMVKRFQRLCHVELDLKIFVKVNSTNRDCIRKTMSGCQCKPQGGGGILMGKGGSRYVILLYWNFIVLLDTVKGFIGYLFSLYFCCFTYFVSIEIGKGKSAS